MNTKCGIVGMPNVGKSTTFNALTKSAIAMAENYPFCTIEPNVAIVGLQDKRLDEIATVVNARRTVCVTLECHDIAGLVQGAHKGEGRGNAFLSHIQSVDVILHVIRTFKNPDIMHVDGNLNPKRDAEAIDAELIFADLDKLMRIKQKTPIIAAAIAHLEQLLPLRSADLDLTSLFQYQLLTCKPIVYALNVDDPTSADPRDIDPDLAKYLVGQEVVLFCAKVEEQIAQSDVTEQKELMDMYDMQESGLNRMMKSVYKKLDLVTYFTAGDKEARGWTIKRNTCAPQAASVIHSDFERLFIVAEVVRCEEFVQSGGWSKCKDAGLVKKKGKTDIIEDGDVCLFRP